MANLCIIPARGGSKRLPKKNIKPFFGKPIIAYSIQAALKSNLFDEIMVSTDNNEIASVAQKYKAKIPFLRSRNNSNDFASTFDVVKEVLYEYSNQDKFFETVCVLYPCAPLVSSNDLKEAFNKLNENVDAVIPVVQFSFPIQRAFKIRGSYLSYMQPEHEKTRSQDLDKAYHDVGQFYISRTEVILKEETLVPKRTSFYLMDEMHAQDIDNETDWKLAELKYRLKCQ
ncbi:pseudaminic acid cytidylyltransferase [Flagellimonas baculiformis]|uniref:pseudaminic acid cytidylyltransferase n=1 Tax=Flagellimonas baculiformis TaxID=3067310 RepID=UPI00296EB964|nr:pseudaminic acid cytidylyltransferase [Muricauda sp. D6]